MLIHHLPDGDSVHHYKKSIVVTFAGKRHVISTGPNNGGYREDLQAVFNHDANPGAGMACVLRDDTYEGHMNVVALEDLGLEPGRCSGLCTAASMKNASIMTQTYRKLTVTAIVTAGIEHNGGRAGDPATYYEENERFYGADESDITMSDLTESDISDMTGSDMTDMTESNITEADVSEKEVNNHPDHGGPVHGTINIILHINADLDAGTLARTIMTATEAKTAALQELMVRSHHSSGLATGSGTDGIITICNPGSSLRVTNAGKNSKLGELIGRTVKAAVKEALYQQTGLCPDKQRDVLRIMGRYGIDEDRLWEEYRKELTKAEFIDRLDRLKTIPEVVDKAFMYVHVMDLMDWGLISPGEAGEMTDRLLPEMCRNVRGKETPDREELAEKLIRYLLLKMEHQG